MRQLFKRIPARLICNASVVSILIFGGLLLYREYLIYSDIPRASCYSVINFTYEDEVDGTWTGRGDIAINMKGGSLYAYYKLKKGASVYTYNRSIAIKFHNLDSSRFLFEDGAVTVHEGDDTGDHAPFMRRGLVSGMVTFSRFSDVEYYYNFNNLLMGVCHVPT